jgi:hypothetical protein
MICEVDSLMLSPTKDDGAVILRKIKRPRAVLRPTSAQHDAGRQLRLAKLGPHYRVVSAGSPRRHSWPHRAIDGIDALDQLLTARAQSRSRREIDHDRKRQAEVAGVPL